LGSLMQPRRSVRVDGSGDVGEYGCSLTVGLVSRPAPSHPMTPRHTACERGDETIRVSARAHLPDPTHHPIDSFGKLCQASYQRPWEPTRLGPSLENHRICTEIVDTRSREHRVGQPGRTAAAAQLDHAADPVG